MRLPVDGAGYQFFARPRFACDQNSRVRGSDLGYETQHPFQRGRRSDDLLAHRCSIDSFSQSEVLVLDSLLRLPWIRHDYATLAITGLTDLGTLHAC